MEHDPGGMSSDTPADVVVSSRGDSSWTRRGPEVRPAILRRARSWVLGARRAPSRHGLAGVLLLGIISAAGVGYLASKNPAATPGGLAVGGRVATIMALILIGVWAQTDRSQRRMGRLLVWVGFVSCLWMLQGSSVPFFFSVGVLFTGVFAVLLGYVMLAHPSGRLRSRTERRFIITAGSIEVVCWTLGVVSSRQPFFQSRLVHCAPHCPRNVLFLGSSPFSGPGLDVAIGLSILVLACGVVILLARRMRFASPPARSTIAPVLAASALYMASIAAFLIATLVIPRLAPDFLILASVPVLSALAIGFGLITERLFMGHALENFVNELAGASPGDLEANMGAALHDASLRILYPRPRTGNYVDGAGVVVAPTVSDGHRAFTEIKPNGEVIAVVDYDAEMSDQGRFVRAAGTAAMLLLENAGLQADLKASLTDLADSRTRLVDSADDERRRIERDLHDGVQQHLVGTRLRLQRATDALRDSPAEAERLLALVAAQVDDALDELRSLARGIYPLSLSDHGPVEALRAVARRSPAPMSVRASRVDRYHSDVETAVYFCCLEAVQNAAKHGGADVSTKVRLWQEREQLRFVIADDGPGFRPEAVSTNSGLANMRDRIEAVGGELIVRSSPGRGTYVRGTVPIGSKHALL